MSRIKTFKSKIKIKHYALCGIALALFYLNACSSDNKPIKNILTVEDPIEIELNGIDDKEIATNVESYLATLPQIAKKRARLYDREIIDKITTALHSYGYYHPIIKIDYPKKNESSTKVVAHVDSGKGLFIRRAQVEIIGQGAYFDSFDKIIKQSGLSSYTLLDHGKYEKLKADIKAKAIELGFFDGKFISNHILVYKEQNVADVVLVYDTGVRYSFGKLIYNDATKELIEPSKSLITIEEGEPFSSKKLNDVSASLAQTNYYKSVDITPKVEDKKDYQVPINIDLERQAKNLYRVGLGYSTDESVRGIFGWDKPLVSKKGHSFSSYVRASRVKQDAQAIYKIPFRNPNLDYFYFKLAQTHTDFNDTKSDLSHFSAHYVTHLNSDWRRDFYLAYEYEDYEQGYEKGYPQNLMAGFLIAKRETTGGLDPKTGYSFTFDNKFAAKGITNYTFYHGELAFKGVFSPTERTRVLYKIYQGANLGSDSLKVPPSMRFFAGGEQNLRGFSYKSESPRLNGKLRGGRYISAATLEYMFPVGIDSSRGAIFLDSAICTNDYKDKEVLLGPGIGYRYMSKYGTLKVDVAYGIDNHNDGRHLKLHLSFGPEF
ncbi:MAG: BamA/TamA family outer membrane protein [Succinivibrio sp.]|jgi:translocation and assembly module TamA|nr:BamA/TamA family outer membrane protein [Succinivibrio sp.]MDY5721537.1 BamA/TamA family outer membrane protein [Succinivibrio sp.]